MIMYVNYNIKYVYCKKHNIADLGGYGLRLKGGCRDLKNIYKG